MTTELMVSNVPNTVPATSENPRLPSPALETMVSEVDPHDFKRSLEKAQKHLDAYQEGDRALEPSRAALTEKQVRKELDKLAKDVFLEPEKRTSEHQRSWVAQMSEAEEAFNALLAFTTLVLGPLLPVVMFSSGSFALGAVFWLTSLIFVFAPLVAIHIGGGAAAYLTVRNRVIRRKAYQREVKRIVHENRSHAEKYAELRAARLHKLERAQRMVEEMGTQYTQSNPGMTLAITSDHKTIEEVKIVEKPKPKPGTFDILASKAAGLEPGEVWETKKNKADKKAVQELQS